MAGSYYVQATTKTLLDIASGDTADYTLLDTLGALADQHIDNIMKKHDEKIPNVSTNVLNDIIMAANYYTAYLYKMRREQPESAQLHLDAFQIIIDGMIEERSIEGQSYTVDRHNSRYGQAHEFILTGD